MTDPDAPIIRRHRLVANDIIDIADYIGRHSPTPRFGSSTPSTQRSSAC